MASNQVKYTNSITCADFAYFHFQSLLSSHNMGPILVAHFFANILWLNQVLLAVKASAAEFPAISHFVESAVPLFERSLMNCLILFRCFCAFFFSHDKPPFNPLPYDMRNLLSVSGDSLSPRDTHILVHVQNKRNLICFDCIAILSKSY